MNVDVEKVVREYIGSTIHMSLATSVDNKPWVSEVHFVYDDNLNLYWRSLASRRHSQEIAANPNVAGDIVRQFAIDEAVVGIYFEGTAELVSDSEERLRVLPLFVNRLLAEESVLDEANRPEGHQFYKITVTNWYVFGKFDENGGQKYQLTWNGGRK